MVAPLAIFAEAVAGGLAGVLLSCAKAVPVVSSKTVIAGNRNDLFISLWFLILNGLNIHAIGIIAVVVCTIGSYSPVPGKVHRISTHDRWKPRLARRSAV